MVKHKVNQVALQSAQRNASTSGASTFYPASSYEFAYIVVYITGKTTNPTLTVTLQCSPVDPNVDNEKWRNIYAEPTITSAMMGTPSATSPYIVGGAANRDWTGWLRIAYSIGGTGNLTFSLNLEVK